MVVQHGDLATIVDRFQLQVEHTVADRIATLVAAQVGRSK